MEKLTIEKAIDVIIVEKVNGNDIEIGSKFYCGCCGNVLGEAKEKIKFPFSTKTFNNSLSNKTFESNIFGLSHKTCRHTMFGFKKEYSFVSLETYIKKYPQS